MKQMNRGISRPATFTAKTGIGEPEKEPSPDRSASPYSPSTRLGPAQSKESRPADTTHRAATCSPHTRSPDQVGFATTPEARKALDQKHLRSHPAKNRTGEQEQSLRRQPDPPDPPKQFPHPTNPPDQAPTNGPTDRGHSSTLRRNNHRTPDASVSRSVPTPERANMKAGILPFGKTPASSFRTVGWLTSRR